MCILLRYCLMSLIFKWWWDGGEKNGHFSCLETKYMYLYNMVLVLFVFCFVRVHLRICKFFRRRESVFMIFSSPPKSVRPMMRLYTGVSMPGRKSSSNACYRIIRTKSAPASKWRCSTAQDTNTNSDNSHCFDIINSIQITALWSY